MNEEGEVEFRDILFEITEPNTFFSVWEPKKAWAVKQGLASIGIEQFKWGTSIHTKFCVMSLIKFYNPEVGFKTILFSEKAQVDSYLPFRSTLRVKMVDLSLKAWNWVSNKVRWLISRIIFIYQRASLFLRLFYHDVRFFLTH